MSITREHTELPPALYDVERLLAIVDKPEQLVITGDGESIALPEPLRRILHEAVLAFASGRAVTVSPHRTVLTTQEAAEILAITRPTMVRLLEAGEIPFTQPGRHRRVELADLMLYQNQLTQRRRTALAALATDDDGSDEPAGFVTTR
ncbi:MAG: helix-turn-helix domain-containing protein [Rhodococcus sp. (in: high G+C Gram-positive bacteria)]